MLSGTVFDGDDPVLTWVEQGVAEAWVPDTVPPEIAASIGPIPFWPPDHEMIQMILDVTVKDKIDSDDLNVYSGSAAWYVHSVSSNQPELGTGDGDYAPDWILPEDDVQSLWLRRERAGNLDTRVYTVTLKALDMAGNETTVDVDVRVEHDEGGG